MVISNALSLQMFDLTKAGKLSWRPITVDEAKAQELESAVGHEDTARILSGMLDKEIKFNRVSNRFESGDKFIVAQVIGGRLPAGATTLPEGTKMVLLEIEVG